MEANSNESGPSPRPTTCETGGELFEDGTLIEVIEDLRQPGGLSLLKFDGTESLESPTVRASRSHIHPAPFASLDSTAAPIARTSPGVRFDR